LLTSTYFSPVVHSLVKGKPLALLALNRKRCEVFNIATKKILVPFLPSREMSFSLRSNTSATGEPTEWFPKIFFATLDLASFSDRFNPSKGIFLKLSLPPM
jgi:hypothetical protein